MRRYQDNGPFLPPNSKRDKNPLKDDATQKEAEATLMVEESGATSKEPDTNLKGAADAPGKESIQNDDLNQKSDDDITFADFVKTLSWEGVTRPDAEAVEKFKKDLAEGVIHIDDIAFKLLFGMISGAVRTRFGLNDTEKESDPSSDVPVVGPSAPSPSITGIKTEKSLAEADRASMAFSLGLIKKEPEENQKSDSSDKNVEFSLDKVKKEKEDQAAGGLPEIGNNTFKFEGSLSLNEDLEAYTLAKYHDAELPTGEGREIRPGPEIQVLELLLALAELEHQMNLPGDKKRVTILQTVEDEEEDEEDQESETESEDCGLKVGSNSN